MITARLETEVSFVLSCWLVCCFFSPSNLGVCGEEKYLDSPWFLFSSVTIFGLYCAIFPVQVPTARLQLAQNGSEI